MPAVNRHAYVEGDPANLTDPTGMAAAVEYGTKTSQSSTALALAKEVGYEICSGLVEAAILGAAGGPSARGQAGEDYVSDILGLDKNTSTMTTASGRGRIPDFVDGDDLFEVKNTSRLSYTRQLKDYVELAGGDGQLTLFTRAGTRLSGPLAAAVRKGAIRLVPCLPGL